LSGIYARQRRNTVPLDFTVIFSSRQHFGADPNALGSDFPPGIFVGQAKDFMFDCPNLIAGVTAFLLFESYNVANPADTFEVNGVGVFGGLTQNNTFPFGWFGNILLLEPRHQLRTTGNVLHVVSNPIEGKLDEFVLDNMIIVFKAFTPMVGPPVFE
jgi:hypothetical protein